MVRDNEERPIEGELAAPAVRVVVGAATRDRRAESVDEPIEELPAPLRHLAAISVSARRITRGEPVMQRARLAFGCAMKPSSDIE